MSHISIDPARIELEPIGQANLQGSQPHFIDRQTITRLAASNHHGNTSNYANMTHLTYQQIKPNPVNAS